MPWLRTLFLLVILTAGCAPRAEIPLAVAATMEVQQVQLESGMVVVLDPDPTAASAVIVMRYHVGLKDDPAGSAGLAHLVEHLTFSSTHGSEAGALDRFATLARFGAVDVNGSTSFDTTDYVEAVPPRFLPQALGVELARMSHPLDGVDRDALRRELAVIKNELRAGHGRHSYGLASLMVTTALFGPEHPYGRILNGTRSEIDTVSLDDVLAFAALHYRPSNATLVVSGRFDVAATRALVTRTFGALPSGPTPPRQVLPAARLARDHTITCSAPVRSREMAVGWILPPPEQDGFDEIALATQAMQGELRRRLTTELHLAENVQVGIGEGHLGSMLVVGAQLPGTAAPEYTLSEMDRALSLVASLGRTFEWDQFGETRLELATNISAQLESPAGRAFHIQDELEYAGRIRSMAAEVTRIQRLRPADVGGATQLFVKNARRAVVIVVPEGMAPPCRSAR